ncbi:MAG TPA: tryptophan--tRNA ligase [Methylomirabilota bacterium]|jgi:tryptophanyl-tRNA synthetase|nr:tryptophan--tRNA ligase [Methylomirabilota bacterium]
MPETIVSGMRPTGKLHLGHLHGALGNWVRLQDSYRCFFFVADWHALTTGKTSAETIRESTDEMVIDWLSAGLDPRRSVIFRQSDVKEHAELHLLFSMITPTPWLIRNPTVKEQAQELGFIQSDDEAEVAKINYGLLGYPVLQAADILMYKAQRVPVGVDQVPHIEITREIARRFNSLYREIFPEPQALLTEIPKVPGTDGRKMSKSYGNAVLLSDPPEEVDAKLSKMMTDPRRVRRRDPGEPADCPAFNLHQIYCTSEEIDYVSHGCRTAEIGCLDCKKVMIKHVLAELATFRDKRAYWEQHRDDVREILREGGRQARVIAQRTMEEVRDVVGV